MVEVFVGVAEDAAVVLSPERPEATAEVVPMCPEPPASGPAVACACEAEVGAALVSEGPTVLGSVPVTVDPKLSAAGVVKVGSSFFRKWEPCPPTLAEGVSDLLFKTGQRHESMGKG